MQKSRGIVLFIFHAIFRVTCFFSANGEILQKLINCESLKIFRKTSMMKIFSTKLQAYSLQAATLL